MYHILPNMVQRYCEQIKNQTYRIIYNLFETSFDSQKQLNIICMLCTYGKQYKVSFDEGVLCAMTSTPKHPLSVSFTQSLPACVHQQASRKKQHSTMQHNAFRCWNLHTPARGGATCDDGSVLRADPHTRVTPRSPPSPAALCRAHA